jgi:hypothetical protein
MSDDSDPTPRYGNEPPIMLEPDPRRRRRTPPMGVPVHVVDQQSRRTRSDSEAPDSVAAHFDALLRRKFRRLWKGVAAAAGIAAGALLSAGKSALDDARKSGAEKVRHETLERDFERVRVDVERLRTHVYGLSARWRRDDQPDPPAAAPASKGTP